MTGPFTSLICFLQVSYEVANPMVVFRYEQVPQQGISVPLIKPATLFLVKYLGRIVKSIKYNLGFCVDGNHVRSC